MLKMKKLFAVLLTLAMVMSMASATFAAEKPSETDHKEVVVSNVEAGSTLTAYQIIDAYYSVNGFVEYRWCVDVNETIKAGDKVTFNDDNSVVGLSDVLVTSVAKDPSGLATVTSNNVTKIDLTVGAWVVLVTPAEDALKIYNPMLASVFYTVGGSDNTVATGNIDADASWSLVTNNAYAKSSEISINKVFVTENTETAFETAYLDWVAFDDVVTYKVTTTVPDYSDEYTSAVFKIYDEMESGLALKADTIVVKANGEKLDSAKYTLNTGAHFIEVSFDSQWILDNRNVTIEIEYDVTVTEDATLNDESNDNKVELTYTNKPGATNKTDPITLKAYTFATNGDIKKVKEDGTTPLQGATFELTNTATNKVYTSVSDENGDVYFKGLDVGTYTLKETIAPEGYTINEKVYNVAVTAEYDADGKTMTSHSITIDGNDTVSITNTKLVSLPSTGGIGTTIFTVGGCAVMIAAAFLFFANRRKEESK